MSLRALVQEWNRFFFAPQSPICVALFRVFHGLATLATLLLLRPDWTNWYGPKGWVSLAAMHQLEPGTRINMFTLIPQTDFAVEAFFWVFLFFTLLLTVGLATRTSSIVTFICLASIHQRDLYVMHGGDAFLRVSGFFLMFAPAGAAVSADRLLRIWRGRETAEVSWRNPWAQRMIQFELTMVYLVSFWWKSLGAAWVDGTALYYVSRLDEVQRFPVPSGLQYPLVMKLASWFTLALEFALGVLLWFRELRYPLLLVGLLFHLCLEYSLNLPMFQWDVLSAYILFVDPVDLERVWNKLRVSLAAMLSEPVTVIYNTSSEQARRYAALLQTVDVLERVRLVERPSAPEQQSEWQVITSSGMQQGWAGFQFLAQAIPLLWPFAIPLYLLRFSKRSASTGYVGR